MDCSSTVYLLDRGSFFSEKQQADEQSPSVSTLGAERLLTECEGELF